MASEEKEPDAASAGAYCELADGRTLMFLFVHVEVEICILKYEKAGLLPTCVKMARQTRHPTLSKKRRRMRRQKSIDVSSPAN